MTDHERARRDHERGVEEVNVLALAVILVLLEAVVFAACYLVYLLVRLI